MKLENPDWRVNSPGPLADGVWQAFGAWTRIIAEQTLVEGKRLVSQRKYQDVLESFKWRFSDGTSSRSPSTGQADADLHGFLHVVKVNTPLFIETWVNACIDLKRQGLQVPTIVDINRFLSGFRVGYQIDGDVLVEADKLSEGDTRDVESLADETSEPILSSKPTGEGVKGASKRLEPVGPDTKRDIEIEIGRAALPSRAPSPLLPGAAAPLTQARADAMYNLFVSGSPSAWAGSPFLLEKDRFLEFTDADVKKAVGDLGAGAVARLERLPCVFAYEAICKKDPLFGVVRRVVGRDRDVRVEYEVVPVVPFLSQSQFMELGSELAIDDFEFHRKHWAVKEVDLRRVLARAGITLPPPDVWRHPINVATHEFDVGLSFPGEVRANVKAVADELEILLGSDRYFYDDNYKAQLARPDLDLLLQDIYRQRSRLVVVFLSEAYENKPWCSGVEFRAIREIIKSRHQQRVMFVRTDDGAVKGTFTLDGAVDARHHSPQEIARMIKQRVDVMA